MTLPPYFAQYSDPPFLWACLPDTLSKPPKLYLQLKLHVRRAHLGLVRICAKYTYLQSLQTIVSNADKVSSRLTK